MDLTSLTDDGLSTLILDALREQAEALGLDPAELAAALTKRGVRARPEGGTHARSPLAPRAPPEPRRMGQLHVFDACARLGHRPRRITAPAPALRIAAKTPAFIESTSERHGPDSKGSSRRAKPARGTMAGDVRRDPKP
jgi:hypothetical protein